MLAREECKESSKRPERYCVEHAQKPEGELTALVRALPLQLDATLPLERAISTAGGVALDGVDEHLMLIRRPGTFVAGEMLDWEAPTGGYLLQGAFSTGVAAAEGALRWFSAERRSTS